MKRIGFVSLLVLIIVNIWFINATPNRDQFKPISIELDSECIATVTCRLIDLQGDCLKTELTVNKPTGYTNSVSLNQRQSNGRPIKLYAITAIESGVAVATYNDRNELTVAQYQHTQQSLTLANGPITTTDYRDATIIDIATNSSLLGYLDNQYYVSVSTADGQSYLVTSNHTSYINSYRFNDVEDHEMNLIISNNVGTLFIISENRTCTNTSTVINVVIYYVSISSNTDIIGITTYTIPNDVCPGKRTFQARYLSDHQIFLTHVTGVDGVAALLDLPSNPSNVVDIVTLQSTTRTINQREISMKSHNQKNISFNFKNIKDVSVKQPATLVPFIYTDYKVTQISFTIKESEALVSLERCSLTCCNTCFIEGNVVDLDLTNSFISRQPFNGTFATLPQVPAANLGYDRLRFDSSYPLIRYNSLCFTANISI